MTCISLPPLPVKWISPLSGWSLHPWLLARLRSRGHTSSGMLRPGSARTLGLRTLIRQWIGPLTISRSAQKLRAFIQEVQPDIVHAMRIPYEGMLTAAALERSRLSSPRFLVSVWGNDFTLHAPSTPLMRYYTRKTMKAVHALHADCERDIRLARDMGLGRG